MTNNKKSINPVLPPLIVGTIAVTLLSSMLPQIKSEWFPEKNCIALENSTCPRADYKRAQQWSGTFNSIRFVFIFLTSGLLGRASDAWGRLPLLQLGNLSSALPVLGLLLTNGESRFIYFTLFVCSGLIGGSTFQFMAYLADTTEKDDRERQFGFAGAVIGLGLVVSPLVSLMNISNEAMFALSFSLLMVNQLYLTFLIPESLPTNKRKPFFSAQQQEEGDKTSSLNPFTPLLASNASPIIRNLSIYVFLTQLAEVGVSEIALIYMADVLDLHGDEITNFSAFYLSLTGVGLLLSQAVLLGILTRYFRVRPAFMLTLSAVANTLHQLVYATLHYYPHQRFAFCNIIITSLMWIGPPVVNGVVSRATLMQGHSLGNLDAIRSLCGAFAPLAFSHLYAWGGQHWNAPQIPFYVGAALSLLSLLLVWGPLRHELMKNVDDGDGVPTVNGGSADGDDERLETALRQPLL